MQDTTRRHVMFWSLAAAGAALDLVTKWAVFAWLGAPSDPGRPPVRLLGELVRLRTAHNTGTFFGLGSGGAGSNTALIVFTVLMTALVVYMYLVPPKEGGGRLRLYTAALGLVFAGAVANLYDRVALGHVRDFIDAGLPALGRWPTFNLADAWLTVGIAAYICALLRMGGRKAGGERGGEEADD